MSVNRYLGGLKEEATSRKKENKIIEELEKSKDWTSYYRKMEFLEWNNTPIDRPIRRIRRHV
jgi:hypothetical protein